MRAVKSRHAGCAALFGCSLLFASGCSRDKREDPPQAADPAVLALPLPSAVGSAPQVLYLPSVDVPRALPLAEPEPTDMPATGRCPEDMVSIRGLFCIDRFEASLIDVNQSRPLSPFFYPTLQRTRAAYESWQTLRLTMGAPDMRLLPVPEPPSFQLAEEFAARARSVRGVTPSGYLSGVVAAQVCKHAGKRLCHEAEWVTACRGETDTDFPYGDLFVPGKCNVKIGLHPAKLLHANASIGHLDPRLNYFALNGHALLHETGSDAACVSRWGADGVYDMVGNLDEWIDDPHGAFLGGFYARNTEAGCAARISAHPPSYFDYSLGVRCCR